MIRKTIGSRASYQALQGKPSVGVTTGRNGCAFAEAQGAAPGRRWLLYGNPELAAVRKKAPTLEPYCMSEAGTSGPAACFGESYCCISSHLKLA